MDLTPNDKWSVKGVTLLGGLKLDTPPLTLSLSSPGSLIEGINFEAGLDGGYRRLSGYTKFDTNVVPNSGDILGVFIFNNGVVAARGADLFFSTGSGWGSAINGGTSHSGAVKYRADIYNWGSEVLAFVDGNNRPAKWDGTTYTQLSNAPLGADFIKEHKNHLFLAKDNVLTWSAPDDDNDYVVANGAGEIDIGFNITGLATWRDALYIFGADKISKLTGDFLASFAVEPVSQKIGCCCGDSIKEVGGDVVFLGPDGVRTIAGTEKIDDIELGNLSPGVTKLLSTIDSSYGGNGNVTAVVVRTKGQYRLFADRSSDADSTAFLGALRRFGGGLGLSEEVNPGGTSWEWFQMKGFRVAAGDSGLIGTTEYVVHADWNGYVQRQEQGNNFDGNDVEASFAIPYLTFEDPTIRKVLQKLQVFGEFEGTGAFTVKTVLDYGAGEVIDPPDIEFNNTNSAAAMFGSSVFGTGTFGGSLLVRQEKNLIGSGKNASFRFVYVGTDAPFTIRELLIQYGFGGKK